MTTLDDRGDWVGTNIRRKEDFPLVTGTARYVADIHLPGAVEVAFVRSPVARARISHIEVTEALHAPGVVTVVTGADIESEVDPFTVDQEPTPSKLEALVRPEIWPHPIEVLAGDQVRHVGQAVVAVVADTRYRAEDGADLVDVEYEELPAVTDTGSARQADAPLIHNSIPHNVQARYQVGAGDVDEAFATAPHTLEMQVRSPRVAASPMETRGVVASHSDVTDELTVWSSTQVPYLVRICVASQLGLAQHDVRVIAPHVGGGFGCKVQAYPEEVLVAHLARKLAQPVRWIEDRSEHLLNTAHARDQVHHVSAAFDNEGNISAICDHFLVDCGAYNPYPLTCIYNPAAHFRSVYRVPHFNITGECVLTNKTMNVPYRGASRPEPAFAMDRIVHEVARRLSLDAATVIQRNLIRPEEMPYARGIPYRDGEEIVYDGGDFPESFAQLLRLVDHPQHRRAQPKLRDRSVFRGVGFGTYVEGSGVGPFESATARLDSRGRLVVESGCTPHGQSHATTMSQVVADEFKMDPDDVIFRAGDTSLIPYGVGTFASRSAVTAGSAALVSAQRLKERITAVASELLEIRPDDLEVAEGQVHVKGAPAQRASFRDIFLAASPGPANRLPENVEPGSADTYYFVPPTVTWGHGFVAAVIEVDIDTGAVSVVQLAISHDCGRILNPQIVEGQIEGGMMQGVGAALYEEMIHDDQGQPLATTFMDYLLPTATETPEMIQSGVETPSERNPLGVKGVGEAGTIAPPAAISNAVMDALRPLNVQINELPLSPSAVATAISQARQSH